MSGPERATVKKLEKECREAWDRYLASVPGTPESIENLRVAIGVINHGEKEIEPPCLREQR